MNKHLTLTELRSNLYQAIDRLIETGVPIEIERKGHHILIALENPPSKMQRLVRRSIVTDPADNLLNTDALSEWEKNNNDIP